MSGTVAGGRKAAATNKLKFCKHIQMGLFEIWHPLYSENRVMLKASRVGEHNKIIFTKAPSMGTEPYYISGKNVKKYKKTTNGTISVYSVPLEELSLLETADHCEHEI